jgi:hypothetical protein
VTAAFDVTTLAAPATVAAVVSGTVALLTGTIAAVRTSSDRRREMFADAYKAYRAYCEMPYAVHRRRHDQPENERARLTEQLREIQEQVGFFEAWTMIEAPAVGNAYADLIAVTRATAGKAITASWERPAITADAQVSVGTSIDLSPLRAHETAYIRTVVRQCHPVRVHLPAWLRGIDAEL